MEQSTQDYTEGETNNSTYVFILARAWPQKLNGTKLEIPQFTLFPDCMLNSLTRPFEHGKAVRGSAMGMKQAQHNIWSTRRGYKVAG